MKTNTQQHESASITDAEYDKLMSPPPHMDAILKPFTAAKMFNKDAYDATKLERLARELTISPRVDLLQKAAKFAYRMAAELLAGKMVEASTDDRRRGISLRYKSQTGGELFGGLVRAIQGFDHDLIWIQLAKGDGTDGWAVTTEADHIWFELIDAFYIVRRADLERLLVSLDGKIEAARQEPTPGRAFSNSAGMFWILSSYEIKKIATVKLKSRTACVKTMQFYRSIPAGGAFKSPIVIKEFTPAIFPNPARPGADLVFPRRVRA